MGIVPAKHNIQNVFSNTSYYIDSYRSDCRWTDEPVLRLLDDIFFKFKEQYARSSHSNNSDLTNSKRDTSCSFGEFEVSYTLLKSFRYSRRARFKSLRGAQ
jgi:hypothetical protein